MRRHRFARLLGLLYLLSQAAGAPVLADDKPATEAPRKYLRVERDAGGKPLAMKTSVVHMVPADPQAESLAVDLVGAVHVGEKTYYETLNKLFEDYDVVLYELVAPEGTRVPKGGRSSGHPVALLQSGLKDLLGLEHQLACVDDSKENFVHADMSPDDFSKSMEERGESFVSMFFRMMGAGIAQQSKMQAQGRSQEFDLLAALLDGDREGAMKRLMADQFESVEGIMEALDGPQGSTIITERNKVALKKLSEQIAAGKKKIAIFYGAGHLNDMEKRLVADFNLKRHGETWLTAWVLDKRPAEQNKAAEPSLSK
jgi:hypothetical protein